MKVAIIGLEGTFSLLIFDFGIDIYSTVNTVDLFLFIFIWDLIFSLSKKLNDEEDGNDILCSLERLSACTGGKELLCFPLQCLLQ